MIRTIVVAFFTQFAPLAVAQVNARPQLTQQNLSKWIRFVEAKPSEKSWQQVRWHKDFEAAVLEARKLKRPVLLWTMNGHPCGET